MRHTLLLVLALATGGCDVFLPDLATTTATGTPTITLSKSAVFFSGTLGASNPVAQTVTVTNSGSGTLAAPTTTVSYSSGSAWLNVTRSTSEPWTLTVQPITSKITSPGTYNASVTVASSGATNSPVSFTVAFTVTSSTPAIAANPASLTFSYTLGGTLPTAQTVAISNAGGGSLAAPTLGAIQYGAGASGWLTQAITGTTVTIGIYTSVFGTTLAGTFTATVQVLSTGAVNSPFSIPVTITVSGTPTLSLSQSSVALTVPYLTTLPPLGSATPPGGVITGSITVNNSGTGPLDVPTTTVKYSTAAGWLSARVLAATSAYPYTALLTLTPQASLLPVGTYSATLTIDSPGASNTPLTATVSLSVTSQTSPVMAMLNGSAVVTGVLFAAPAAVVSPTSQVLTIANAGGGALALPTAPVPPAATSWLTTSVTGAGPTYSLTLTPNPTGLTTPGIYTASVPIYSTGALNSGTLLGVRVDATTSATRNVSVTRIGQYTVGDGSAPITNPLDDITSMTATMASTANAASKASVGYWNVTMPTGPYLLEVDFTSGYKYFFEEDASTVDVGFMIASRTSTTAASASTVATLHLSGLQPWAQNTDYLQVSSMGARFRKFFDPSSITAGATSTNSETLDWYKDPKMIGADALNLLVSTDSFAVNQFRWLTLNSTDGYYRSVAGGRITASPAMTSGSPTSITVALATTTDTTATYNWYLTNFESALLGAVDQLEHWTVIEAYPTMTTSPDLLFNGTVGGVTLLQYYPTRRGADLNAGAIAFGRFLTGVAERRKVECDGVASRSYPGATTPHDYSVYVYNEETLSTALNPIVPLVGPVSYVAIGGKSASLPSAVAGIGTTPVVTWIQPQLGSPSQNIVSFYELGTDASNSTTSKFIGAYYTKAVVCAPPAYCLGMIKVPAAMGLTAGKYYVMEIETDAAGPSYTIASPFDRGQPYGEANFVSEVFTP